MPDHLQKIASASTEAEQMTAQRIALQHLLHLQCQAMGSPCAYRCDRSPATPERRSGPESSVLQNRQDTRQRRGINVIVDHDATPAHQHDLYRARRHGWARGRVFRCLDMLLQQRKTARRGLATDHRLNKRRRIVGRGETPFSRHESMRPTAGSQIIRSAAPSPRQPAACRSSPPRSAGSSSNVQRRRAPVEITSSRDAAVVEEAGTTIPARERVADRRGDGGLAGDGGELGFQP